MRADEAACNVATGGQDKYEKSDLAAAARALSTNLPPAIMGDFSGGCPTSWFNQFSGALVVRLVCVSDPQITLPAVLLWPCVWPGLAVVFRRSFFYKLREPAAVLTQFFNSVFLAIIIGFICACKALVACTANCSSLSPWAWVCL